MTIYYRSEKDHFRPQRMGRRLGPDPLFEISLEIPKIYLANRVIQVQGLPLLFPKPCFEKSALEKR